MCKLLSDTNWKNGTLPARINDFSIVLENKRTERLEKISRNCKRIAHAVSLKISRPFTMDLAATISQHNEDSITTVEECIIQKGEQRKEVRISKPKAEKQNDTDYVDLKKYRKNYEKSVQSVKDDERKDLKLRALLVEETMLAEHAARREAKRAAGKTDEQKEEARKFYKQRAIINKRKAALKNGGNIGPLDFENQLTMEWRLRYYNRHHKCICGKKFNIIFKGKDAYIVRCSHKSEVPSRVSSSKKCISCGSNKLEIQATKCGCKNYYCNRCHASNYFYKDIKDPDSNTLCTAYQSFDCHPGSNDTNDLHFTIKVPDHHIETSEGPCPVAGSIKDLIIKQDVITKDVNTFIIKKNDKRGRKKFFTTLKGDLGGFSWADRVQGFKSVNVFEALDVEEPKDEEPAVVRVKESGKEEFTELSEVQLAANLQAIIDRNKVVESVEQSGTVKIEEPYWNFEKYTHEQIAEKLDSIFEKFSKKVADSEEQGGMVSTALNSSKAATESAYNTVKGAIMEVLNKIIDLKRSVCEAFSLSGVNIIGSLIEEKFDFLYFVLKMIYANLDFEVLGNLIFIITRCITDGVFNWKSFFANTFHLGMIAVHLARNTWQQLDILKCMIIPLAPSWSCKYVLSEDEAHLESRQGEEAAASALNKVPVLKPILHKIFKDLNLSIKYVVKVEGKNGYVKLNQAGLEYVESLTIASLFRLIGTQEQSGIDGICDCIHSTYKTLFSNDMFRSFFKFMKEATPIFVAYRGVKEIVKDLGNLLAKFIMGDLPPNEWLDQQLYLEGSPVHELYATYQAYIATTVPGAKKFVSIDVSEMRTAFYVAKEKCEKYVMDEKKFSAKYSSWIRHMESGMTTAPQPTEREFEPTVLVLYGAPGVGKSTVWPHIVSYCLGITPKEVRETTHTWNSASEYQPGMANKRVILFDDFGQNRMDNDETLNLIRLCTSAPYMVNSANIVGSEIKGMFAQPEIIVLCTNDADLATDKVYSGAAVIRRMDLFLTMNERLDFNNPDVLKVPSFHVNQSARYAEIEKKKISLADVAGLFKVTHLSKLESFKKINRDLVMTFDKIDLNVLLNQNAAPIGQLPGFFVTDGNLAEDWKKHILKGVVKDKHPDWENHTYIKKELKKMLQRPNINKSELVEFMETYEKHPKHCAFIYDELVKIGDEAINSDNDALYRKTKDMLLEIKRIIPENKETLFEKATRWITSKGEESVEQSLTFSYLVSQASAFILNLSNAAISYALPSYIIAAYVTLVNDMRSIFQRPTVSRICRTLAKTFALAIGGVCLSVASYHLLKMLSGKEGKEESGTTKTSKISTPTLIVNSTAQAGMNEMVIKRVKGNTGTLISHSGRQINCVAIGGQWILTARHFFVDFTTKSGFLKDGTEICIVMSNGHQFIPFKFDTTRFVQIENHTELFDGAPIRSDVALYHMDEKLFPSYPNIIKHFWNGSYNCKNIPVCKVDYVADITMTGERADLIGNLKIDRDNSVFEIDIGVVEDDQVMTVRTKGFDRYYHCVATATYRGRDKSCGSIVMRTDVQEQPILGIHVAAVMKNGLSMFHFVTAAELIRATSSVVNVTLQESPYVNYGADVKYQSDLPDNHQFYYLGTTDRKHRIFQPRKTELQPSLLYEAIGPHITEPSILSKDDKRIPEDERNNFWPVMFEGYAKYTNLTFDDIEEAVQSVISDNRKLMQKHKVSPRVLNDVEVLNGSEEFPTLGRVPLDTSCGWPYTCEGIKKDHLIKERFGTLLMKERLHDDWKDAEECLNNGIVPFLPFVATIKDERVKLKKIYETPKSRLFMAGNVVNYMINRKYYGWFMDMMNSEQWSYAVACLDRVSVEWHYFISSLIEVGPYGFAADFKWWDKFVNAVLKYAAFLIDIDGLVIAGKIEVNSPKYCALRELKCRTIVIFGEVVYLSNGIEPSGELLTFLDNCNMNEVVHRTAYLQITRKLSPMDGNISTYRNKTRGGRAGDDTIQMVAASLLPYFNGKTFKAWCESKNISITSADKSDAVLEHEHFKVLQFVKNTTGVMHGYYVPQANIIELVEQCYWVRLNKNNRDIVKATSDNTNAALRGLYYWGPDIFNEIRDAFLKKCPQLDLLTFRELDAQWKEYGFFPGSHSDYATQTDQDIMRTFDPAKLSSQSLIKHQWNFRKYGPISSNNREMKILESQEQAAIITGKDTASMNADMTHMTAGLDESLPAKVIDDVPPAKSSNVIGSETQVNGAFIQSKEEPVRQQLRTGKVVVAPSDFRAQGHLNDKNWTLSKLASKFTSLGQISWPISATAGTILKKWNLPNEILTTPALKTPFDVTVFERFQSITFKITSSASPFYAGRLICGFIPSMQFQGPNVNPNNVHLILTQLGGVVLNPTDNQTVEYSIPFRHYLNWLEYPNDLVGQFYIAVLNPLLTGPGNINNVTISVFVSVENCQFKVPEYVGPVTKSQMYLKSMSSKPQSGDVDYEDTAIVVSKKINTVNEDFQSNATMMCAGTGVYVEPTVKQFPDHPIDLIQLLKRDNIFAYETMEIPAHGNNKPGFISLSYPVHDISRQCVRETGDIFAMYRGGLLLKASFFAYFETTSVPDAWEGKVFFANQDLPVSYSGSLEDYNYYGNLNMGYHKFDQLHPASVTVPHWSPNFASFMRGEPIPFETSMSWVTFEFYNWSPKPITIVGNIEARVDDDFTMGVFTGFGPISFSPVPHLGSKYKNIRKIVRKSNDIDPTSQFVVVQSKYQSGNIIDTAQDWVTDKAIGLASGVVKAGVDSVFDLARENLEPVMDIVDAVGNLLDAPPVTLQAAPYMPRKWNYGNANNIMQYAEKLGVTNHNGGCYSDKTTYGTSKIETNLYDLCTNVKTLWKTINWPANSNSGTLLNYFQVGVNGTEDILNNNSKVACPMDAFARFFNYWSGSIIYAFDVVASQMHTGRLVISFHPNLLSLPQNFSLDMATQQYFLSFDLDKGKGCAVVEAPYLYKRPFKPIPLLDSVGQSVYPFDEGFNGIMCLWVMNPLRSSETVASNVQINIYKMAGRDFRFEGYGSTLNASMALN